MELNRPLWGEMLLCCVDIAAAPQIKSEIALPLRSSQQKVSAKDEQQRILHTTITRIIVDAVRDDVFMVSVFDCLHMRPLDALFQMLRNHQVTSDEVVLCGLVYLQRFLDMTGVRITQRNHAALLLLSVMTASKFMEDIPFDNSTFARMAAMDVRVINRMEIFFLTGIRFDLGISDSEITDARKYCSHKAMLLFATSNEMLDGEFDSCEEASFAAEMACQAVLGE